VQEYDSKLQIADDGAIEIVAGEPEEDAGEEEMEDEQENMDEE